MAYDFDAIVIGSGPGGAAFAHACATAGKQVLVIERGRRASSEPGAQRERVSLIDKHAYDDRTVAVNDVPLRLYMGGVVGGGSTLFGAAMLRPSCDDFHPGRSYGDRLPREIWDWPISYSELAPYYDEAELLYRLAANHDDAFSPLNSPCSTVRNDVIPIAPINERLMSACRADGLQPFRLPLAIDASRCQRCDLCAGVLCPHDARRSAAHLIDDAAATCALSLACDAEVERLSHDANGRIDHVVVRSRKTNELQRLSARCYVLAAGAIGSPALLLKSGLDGPHVGRNFMMHYSPIVAGVFPASTGAADTFVKQVGLADFYFGTKSCPHKLGLIQSLPAPGPLMLAKNGFKRWPQRLRQWLRRRLLPLVGIVEDLPHPANRVYLNRDGGIALSHSFSPFDLERGRALTREMRRLLRRTGALHCASRALPSQEHVAHQCGTLRFGTDPKHAAVDRDGRLFGVSNLVVADGSVLPTSTGVGPSLTIVANALRAARAAMATM